jgi:hypothetical protein
MAPAAEISFLLAAFLIAQRPGFLLPAFLILRSDWCSLSLKRGNSAIFFQHF